MFRCDLEVEWHDEEIAILSHWDCTVGNLENLLNSKAEVKMPIEWFLCEWKIKSAYIYIKCGRMKLFNNGLSVQGT